MNASPRSSTWLRGLALCIALGSTQFGGCGGGVGEGGTGGFAAGPITGFGSVIVNDVRFDDATASVQDGDGNSRSRDDLRLGMTVEVTSTAITSSASGAVASAQLIRVDSDLLGPVTAVDVAGSSFMLLGQRVAVDAVTAFADTVGGLAALKSGTLVEVFAVFDPALARYRATRVASASSSDVAHLRGQVSQLDGTGQTLRVGSTTYAFASAAGIPTGLANGQFVRMKMTAQPQSGRYTVLSFGTALPSVPDSDGASVKGLISSFTSSAAFSVGGRPVDASSAVFPKGSAGLALGVRVEVQGSVRNGSFKASSVSIQSDGDEANRNFELHGNITAVNTALRTFVLRGLTVSTTRPDLRYQNGTAANLVVGRSVEVKGVLSGDGLRIDAININFE